MIVPGRRRNRRAFVIVALVLILLALLSSARFYTDLLWFDEVGFTSVLLKSLWTQFIVGGVGGLLAAAIVWLNLWIAGRIAPTYRTLRLEPTGRPDPLDRYRELLTPYTRWLRLAVALGVGILSGLAAAASWQDYLLFANRVSFGREDPQFGRDAGFYVFELPFLKDVLAWLWFALIVALLVSAVAHYFFGSIRPEFGWSGVIPGAMAHLSVLLGCLALIKAGQYYLGQFELNFSARGVVTGASYTDVHAQLPALRLLAIVSVISAILFLVNIRMRRLSLPLAAVGIWILFAVLAGGLWPLAIQRFSVEPQELQRERPYIERNIEATRFGFDLGEVDAQDFLANSDLSTEQAQASNDVLQNVRVWDPGILRQAYSQLQAIRTYYRFDDVDVDRYEIDGQARQILLSARELSVSELPSESQTWANQHLRFTHGYGIVASLANASTAAGQPEFLVKDIPGTIGLGADALDPEQPRLYFGESFEPNEYSIVNSRQEELDFSTQDGTEDFNYDGRGGVVLNSFFKRLAFAVRETDPNMILSNFITPESRILLYRDVRDRVHRAAPFLALDSDPYPAVVGGRIAWVVDAYTTSQWYPYSQRENLTEIIPQEESAQLSGSANYIRNSVKVVVDAYDGTMEFYIVDPDDPLVQAWSNAFPDLFSEEEPTEELRAHFRYPEDLFRVQSEAYLAYHMDTANEFYAKEDQWDVPDSPQSGATATQLPDKVPPTYLLITLPGETESEFVLTRPFTPRSRPNMVALMVARSDPENYGDILTLEFPRSKQVPGPVQVNNIINQEPDISRELTLLGQGGSTVDFGSLVILPVEDSILYVQPIFVTADSGATTVTGTSTGIPELKRVVAVSGEKVAMGIDFESALAGLFDLDVAGPEEPTEPPPPTGGEPGEEPQGELADVVDRAGRVYDQAQQALSDGDFETYGRLINRLGDLIQQAEQLSQAGG